MKIATWNVNSLRVRLPQLTTWLAEQLSEDAVDVIALQETKTPNDDFSGAEIEALGWHVAFSGQRTYNGVAILSRMPLSEPLAGLPEFTDEQKRVLAVTIGDVRVVDVFRKFEQPEQSFSWWDYRAATFRPSRGLRIDLILAGAAMSSVCLSCQIDRQPRTWERPSDHPPVIARFKI